MPVSKARAKHIDLVQEVAALLDIPRDHIYLMSAGSKRNQLRIWSGNMSSFEKNRVIALKEKVKAMAEKYDTKIAISDKQPEEQADREFRRRKRRNRAYRERNPREE